MSVSTTDVVDVSTTAQVSTLPKTITVPAKVREVLAELNPDHVATLIAQDKDADGNDTGAVENFAARVAGAYLWTDTLGQAIDRERTLTGAYVVQMLGPEGKGKPLGEIATMLNTSNSNVTRYRYIARLIFHFGFTPADPEFPKMTSEYVSKSEFNSLLKAKGGEKVTRDEVLAAYAKLSAPKPAAVTTGANVGGSAAESSEGQSTTSRGSQEPKTGTPVPRNNAGILAEVEKLLSNLKAETLSPAEWATLHGVASTVEGLLDAAPDKVRTSGQKITAKAE